MSSLREIGVGDLIHLEDKFYIIKEITPNELITYVLGHPLDERIFLRKDLWMLNYIPKENTFEPFTKVPEVDTKILESMDEISLSNICQTNRYASLLCENLYYHRVLQKFPEYEKLNISKDNWKSFYNSLEEFSDFIVYKEGGQTWTEYYKVLKLIFNKKELDSREINKKAAIDNSQYKLLFDVLGFSKPDIVYVLKQKRNDIMVKIIDKYDNILKVLGYVFWINANSELLDYLYEHTKLEITPYVVNLVAKEGNINVIRWLKEIFRISPTNDGILYAIENGKLDFIKWIWDELTKSEQTSMLSNINSINDIASKGYLDVLKWIKEKGGIVPNKVGINNATMHGHLNVIKWIYQETKILPDLYAINSAASSGYLYIIKWIRDNGGQIPTENIQGLKNSGHYAVARWIEEQKRI